MATPQQFAEDDASKRRREALESVGTISLSATPSWGERLLPYVFAAMETCWIDAVFIGLASLGFPQLHVLFMPLWIPFVLISGALWLGTYLERRGITTGASVHGGSMTLSSGFVLVLVPFAVVTLFAIWSGVYASSIALYDPRWLGALVSDVLLLSANLFHLVGIIALAVYFCSRGLRLSRGVLEPGDVLKMLRLGIGVIVTVILLRAVNGAALFDELFLLLLIPLFLAFALTAHALAQALFVRRFHPNGLQGSIVAQERFLLVVIGAVGIVLVLASLVMGSLASPAFLAQVQHVLEPVAVAYDWLARAIAYIAVLFFIPIVWLLQFFHVTLQLPRVVVSPAHLCVRNSKSAFCAKKYQTVTHDSGATAIILLIIKLLLPVLILVFTVLLIRWALRRRRIKLTMGREDDMHESLWSWKLFLTQLKAFLHALWLRLFPAHPPTGQQQSIEEGMPGEPMARNIREIYRAMLHWAANHGYARKKDETPYEFRSRLDERMPLAEPELGALTEAYTGIRYGRAVPSEAEVAHMQQAWMQLQQKFLQ